MDRCVSSNVLRDKELQQKIHTNLGLVKMQTSRAQCLVSSESKCYPLAQTLYPFPSYLILILHSHQSYWKLSMPLLFQLPQEQPRVNHMEM